MKAFICLLSFMVCGWHLGAQNLTSVLARIRSLPPQERQAIADSLVKSCKTFPIVEQDSLAHFVYSGTAGKVSVAGDATGWAPTVSLERIEGTNLWYKTLVYEPDARLDYKFVVDGSNWILDPGNPHTCMGGFGPNSELRMGKNTTPPEVNYFRDIPHGTFRDTVFFSRFLNNRRTVTIYLPPSYAADKGPYPLVLFHDGPDYVRLASAGNIIDYLIAHKMIRPLIAVFVPAVDRDPEYAGEKISLFTEFITGELLPWVDASFKTSKDPWERATIGASNGGNIALYLGVKKPSCFGRIAAQSSNVIPEITATLQKGPKLKLDFYLDIGKYDIPELIPMVYGLDSLLRSKKYSCRFLEIHDGHSWGNWKEHLRLPLMQFFPYASQKKQNNPKSNAGNH